MAARLYWLSFVDSDRIEGERFLGVCVVEVTDADAAAILPEIHEKFPNAQPEAEWIAAATRKAHRLGCNPGGEVATIELKEGWPFYHLIERDRLLTREELYAYTAKPS